MAINKWEFVGLDGKNCLFASDRVRTFIPPHTFTVDVGTLTTTRLGFFAGGGRTVVVWSNDELGQHIFVDIYNKEVDSTESAREVQKEIPTWEFSEPCAEYFPESNYFLEIGKYFLFCSESELRQGQITHTPMSGFRRCGPNYSDFLHGHSMN